MPIEFVKFAVLGVVSASLVLGGCASRSAKDAAEANQIEQHPVTVDIYGGSNLNADDRGRPMALVIKLYRLKDPDAFQRASVEDLATNVKDHETLGDDLVDVKELVLTPGQQIEREQILSSEVGYLGVMAEFRNPFKERWKFVFADKGFAVKGKNAKRSLVIGVHECAMTVSEGTLYQSQGINPGSLGGVVCRAPAAR